MKRSRHRTGPFGAPHLTTSPIIEWTGGPHLAILPIIEWMVSHIWPGYRSSGAPSSRRFHRR